MPLPCQRDAMLSFLFWSLSRSDTYPGPASRIVGLSALVGAATLRW